MNYQKESAFYHPLFEETENSIVSIYFETSPSSQNLSKHQIKLRMLFQRLRITWTQSIL